MFRAQRAWVLVVLVSGAAQAQEGGEILLLQGSSRELSVPGLTKVAIGDPAIADVKALGGSMLKLEGHDAGKTTLLVWVGKNDRRNFLITVRTLQEHLTRLLGPTVTFRRVEKRLVVEGRATSQAEAERIARVVAQFPAVQNLVHYDADAPAADAGT